MKLLLERQASGAEATRGVISVDGAQACCSLEDQHQAVKVANETRIPAGTYKVRLKPIGTSRFDHKYQAKFQSQHRGMLEIMDVPGFTGVLIHIGNTDDDSSGCILVGSRVETGADGSFFLAESTKAYLSLYQRVVDAAAAGTLEIQIVDKDR